MTDWTGRLDSLLGELDAHLRGAARAVRRALHDAPYELLLYRGYGNASGARVHGRAVERRGVDPSSDSDSTLRNLLNSYRRVDSHPLGGARLSLRARGTVTPLIADNEGFFSGHVAAPAGDAGDEWQPYEAELLLPATPGSSSVTGAGQFLVPPQGARFGVISDIDDTVIQSQVSNFLQAARTVVLGNARTRLPFPGVAAYYRALRGGSTGEERNPVFYVSSSPWNIYDVIAEFMELQGIPAGPILLRDWDVTFGALASARHFEHKLAAIRDILGTYPAMSFILIGDTTQQDPEIYSQVVRDFPDRILAIYIRDVTRTADRTARVQALAADVLAARSSLVLSEDTLGAARHAVEQGWIRAESLVDVQDEKRADTGQSADKVATPDGGETGTGKAATVIE